MNDEFDTSKPALIGFVATLIGIGYTVGAIWSWAFVAFVCLISIIPVKKDN